MDADPNVILPVLPRDLQIEITSCCNLRCRMCPLTAGKTSSSLRAGHLTQEVWEQILPAARDIGKAIISGFGEPLLHPQCLSLLHDLNRAGVSISLATNGIALTPSLCQELAALEHLTHINISIDSPDPEIYRDIRGGSLDKALTGAQHLIAALDDPRNVTVSSILMNQSLASLSAFPPLLAELGVRHYVLQGLIDYNLGLDRENPLHQKGLAASLTRIKAACEAAGIELLFTLPARLDLEIKQPAQALQHYYRRSTPSAHETRQCCLPWELPFINKDGLVFPCCYSTDDTTAILGDVRTEPLRRIWHGEKYQAFRRQLLSGKPMPQVCQTCTAASLGEHPLLYSAKILYDQSVLADHTKLRLVVQNTGSHPWIRDDLVRIGTPQDRKSRYVHPSWYGANRIATFREKAVPPGGTATFCFRIDPDPDVPSETFQVVFEGKRWLPGTEFEIRPGRARENPLVLWGYRLRNSLFERLRGGLR
ncbi:radical SAM protein [candidate division KSB3 bacterium]|uniref:Radical SAM protein n=1 Tax=candidate division KSB3 bacterium TaxID=2044937 RepID=A0A9D5Q634_9BACT|nr:radical SAM protein [candidate division KSB3 bacterium]MBD3325439.1 radical SAM protein [candidate division KSB3 bacterium]